MTPATTQQSPPRCCVVISFYDRRQPNHLYALLTSLERFPSGAPFDVAIVVNQTNDSPLQLSKTRLPAHILYRHNTGMNIGAWDFGWRALPDYDYFLFLQDECYVVREDWLARFIARADRDNAGLICESMNTAWDLPWEKLRERESDVHLPDHGNGRSNRVDTYLEAFERWSTQASPTARHARALVWFAKRDVLERIDGFPIGHDYGECIAAEIAVSQRILSAGLTVEQVDEVPFFYIRHAEWNRDHASMPFTKQSILVETLRRERKQRKEIANPSWRFIGSLILRRLRHSIRQTVRIGSSRQK